MSEAKATILIVDDEASNRKLLADLVRHEGHTAIVAADGSEALAIIAVEPVDLVLLDLMMPRLDGMAVLTELQRQGRLPRLPVVVVSANDGREDRISALTAGAIDFVMKPIDRFEIACRMRSLIELKRLRDRSEADAAGARAQLQGLLDSAPDYVVSIDRNGLITYINREVPTQIIGSSWESYVTTPDEGAALKTALGDVLATGRPSVFESRAPGPDGAPLWFESHIGPVRLGEEIVGAVIVARDNTAKKRAEEQLVVSERMASVGTLAAGVAHEINNPLAALIANLRFVVDDLAKLKEDARAHGPDGGGESPWIAARLAEVAEPLQDANDAAERIRLIVRDLKIFSRVEEEKTGAVDLRPVLESSLRMAWNEIRHRARLVKDYGDTPPVAGSDAKLGQVFLNLLVNAAQAIPEGVADKNEIRIVTKVDDHGIVTVEVQDTGPGIPAALLSRVFDPFFTTKPAGVGTGLGLAICHRIVTGIGGEIRIESSVGKGTVVRVTLPVAKCDAVEALPKAPPVASSRRGVVLVVDDEPLLGRAVRRVLSSDHDVVVLTSGREVIAQIRAGKRFDVILSDLMMPDVTGMDLHAELSLLAPDQAAKMVFMTGGAFTARAREFLERTENPRVDKPLDEQNLRALVHRLLR